MSTTSELRTTEKALLAENKALLAEKEALLATEKALLLSEIDGRNRPDVIAIFKSSMESIQKSMESIQKSIDALEQQITHLVKSGKSMILPSPVKMTLVNDVFSLFWNCSLFIWATLSLGFVFFPLRYFVLLC